MNSSEYVDMKDKAANFNAQNKTDYWKTVGTSLLGSGEYSEKWCKIVDEKVNAQFDRGIYLDETLQLMSMIKSGVPNEVVAKAIKELPDGLRILDDYLGAFIHPETLENIKQHLNSMKL